MRAIIQMLGSRATVSDFEEMMLKDAVRASVKLWYEGESLAGFAYVDDYNNLWFEYDPKLYTVSLGDEFVAWGIEYIRARNQESGSTDTLDASCSANDELHLPLLRKHGFEETEIRSLKYERSISLPVEPPPLPEGFTIRSITRDEVEKAVELHHAVLNSDHIDLENRLAIMDAPGYLPDLDLVVVAPDGRWAAYCICGEEEVDGKMIGYTDPIGVHPDFRGLGLAKTVTLQAIRGLINRGVALVEVGTSSKNTAMQRLAEALGFKLVRESLWFSKKV